MKNGLRIILFITAVLILALSLAGCGSAAVESVYLEDDSGFQTVYVKGQELKLSDAYLTVKTAEGTERIPLDSSGVTVSGYDKSTTGRQTVKIEYGGTYTDATVSVVERVTVNGAVADYLVGDAFDKSRGVVKVTDDSGRSVTVQLSSSSVTVEGFDSSSAKSPLTLSVKYTGNGEVYEGNLEVNIHAIESIDFHRPNKVTYGSHYEGAPDASGGRFVIKGAGGSIRREVVITSDMIKGLDVSMVNAENKTLPQTLTVTYGGKDYTYDVQLIYTDISLFKDNEALFDAVDWNGAEEPVIGEELGELALTLMNAYVDMSASERSELDEGSVFDVARTAMVYGFEVWGDNIREFRGVFAIEYGERVLYLESYNRVSESLALFEDKESAIYSTAPLLLELIEMYGDRVIYENETTRICFSTYPVMDSYEIASMEAMLRHAITLYDHIKSVPETWRETGLYSHHDSLRHAIVEMFAEGYVFEYPDLYYLVSEWREGDDLFDMLYTYLYEENEVGSIKTLMLYGLPGGLESFYTHSLTALLAVDDLSNVDRMQLDTTKLIYNYYLAKDAAERIAASADTAEHYIYYNVSANLLFGIDSIVQVSFGDVLAAVRASVLEVTEGLCEEPLGDAILRKYVNLIHNSINIEDYEGTPEYAKELGELFDAFISLPATEQYDLLSSLNFLYKKLGIPELAFDDTDENAAYTSLFTVLINRFMKDGLREDAEIYDDLILAIEIYANRFEYSGWEKEFTERMDAVDAAISTIAPVSAEFFERYLSSAYEKYKGIRESLGKTVELGEWSESFDALSSALRDTVTAAYLIDEGGVSNYNYFFASYERALEISRDILARAPGEVVYAYYHEPLFEAYSDGEVCWTFDYAINRYRTTTYISTLLRFGADEMSIYDAYREREMGEFLCLYYDMVSAFVNKTEGATPAFDKNEVIGVLEAFKSLDSTAKALFYTLEGGVNMYGAALELFISEAFTEGAGAVAHKLFRLETAFYTYEVSGSGVTLESVRSLLAELTAAYSILSDEDKESFRPLMNIYSFYAGECEKLIEA